jgi:hypothetical protein
VADFEVAYFRFSFFGQSLLVNRHAALGTEAHPPVTMNAKVKLSSTMIASHGH